ncbi:MIR motif-containing protein, partial [Dimargaris cristalligena]
GTGSGQRSVTGLDKKAGAAGYWVVYAPVSSPLTSADPTPQRGDKVPCGAVVRLQHPESTTFLHSHRFQSPISNQQEVSAFDGQDEGDNWVIECAQGTQYWSREKRVALRHQVTNYYLAADSQYKYNSPIPGQLEIFGQPRSNDNSQWMAQ